MRLNFGIDSAVEIFHEEMANTLADISNCDNIYDDILMYAVTQREHDLALIRVFQRHLDCSPTLGKDKCKIKVPSVKFFGFIFFWEWGVTGSRKSCCHRRHDPSKQRNRGEIVLRNDELQLDLHS